MLEASERREQETEEPVSAVMLWQQLDLGKLLSTFRSTCKWRGGNHKYVLALEKETNAPGMHVVHSGVVSW